MLGQKPNKAGIKNRGSLLVALGAASLLQSGCDCPPWGGDCPLYEMKSQDGESIFIYPPNLDVDIGDIVAKTSTDDGGPPTLPALPFVVSGRVGQRLAEGYHVAVQLKPMPLQSPPSAKEQPFTCLPTSESVVPYSDVVNDMQLVAGAGCIQLSGGEVDCALSPSGTANFDAKVINPSANRDLVICATSGDSWASAVVHFNPLPSTAQLAFKNLKTTVEPTKAGFLCEANSADCELSVPRSTVFTIEVTEGGKPFKLTATKSALVDISPSSPHAWLSESSFCSKDEERPWGYGVLTRIAMGASVSEPIYLCTDGSRGDYVLSARLDKLSVLQDVNVQPQPAKFTFSTDPSTPTANNPFSITALLSDCLDLPIGDAEVTITSPLLSEPLTGMTTAKGQITAMNASAAAAGSYKLDLRANSTGESCPLIVDVK